MEYLGFRLQLGAQPFHELPVLLGVLALHHHHQIVLRRKLLLEPEEILVVLLVGPHQVIAARVELNPGVLGRYQDAQDKQHYLPIKEQPWITHHHPCHPGQESRNKTVSAKLLDLHAGDQPLKTQITSE